jgi:uncharacterized protein YjiS (DUF1127 family)
MTAIIVSAVINSHEAGLFRNALATLRVWRERSRTRRALAQWNERDLHDIGLSWSSVSEEVNKPFWRA